MWYRIELNKDNSISSCVEAEGSRKNGRAVHYIEANSKQEAIKLLLARFERRVNRQRELAANSRKRAIASGMCTSCKGPKEGDARECDKCKARRLARQRERRSGRPLLRTVAEKLDTPDALRRQLQRDYNARLRAKKHADAYWVGIRRTISECLQAFDSMTPSSFRTWLAERLVVAQGKERASAERRAARFAARESAA